MELEYCVNKPISAEQFVGLLQETTLGPRRPVDDQVRIQGMLDNANLTITAWSGNKLVGIARSVTDFHFCCYLSDLAVSESVQAKGIGKELIRQTFYNLNQGCKIVLLAAPLAEEYYPRIGFSKRDSAWYMTGVDELK